MRSSLIAAILATSTGAAPRPRSLDLVWAALSPTQRMRFEREAARLASEGVQATPLAEGPPLFHTGLLGAVGRHVLAVCAAPGAVSGVTLARRAAQVAVGRGVAVLAGDTDGPEAAAVQAALECGGYALSVLAQGIRLAPAAAAPGLVTVSPCAPDQPWSMDAAMARNAAVVRLCTALVAIGAGNTGATLDVAMRALVAGRPVLAVGATPGSRLLVDYGADAAADELELVWWLERLVLAASHQETGRGCAEGVRSAGVDRYSRSWHPLARHWSTA